jgi:chromosomal replication initiator protein
MPRTEYSDLEVIESSPTSLFASQAAAPSPLASSLLAPSRNLEAHSNVLVNRRSRVSQEQQQLSTFQPVSDTVLPTELHSSNGAASSEVSSVAAGVPSDVTEAGATNIRNAAEQIWKRCVETLRSQLSAQTMRTWFEPLEATQLEGTQLTLRTPSSFFSEWITEHYDSALETAIRDVLGNTASFRFEISSDLDSFNTKLEPANGVSPQPTYTAPAPPQYRAPQPPPQPTAPAFSRPAAQAAPSFGATPQNGQKRLPESNLNPRYTFDTFIRGESNKLAFAAANAVANNPGGTRYNPLVIYGSVGLGKTHLIQAVGNAAIQKFPAARVLYTSSDRFTVEFVDAIQNDRINEFQSLYRSIDLLIIDDVQFFAGKEKTQDIFFHTFNALRELGKQIILTCDRAPKELKDIDDRLLNRLQWGLTADIGTPDLETRIAILRHKALGDGVDLTNDIIEFIATNVTTNIRELEGCLISLLATASLEGKEPTIDLAREVLRKVAKRSTPMLTIETIQRTVAKKFNVEEELLRAKTRKQEVVQARQVAMFLAKELTNHSLKSIGLHFGGRDHSTVIHAVQAILEDSRHDQGLSAKLEDLRRQFEMMH